MDFFVTMITNANIVKTSDQIAASWGYFDTVSSSWNESMLKDSGFPVDMLPEVMPSGSEAGNLCDQWFGIPAGTPVGVALGDLQCSVRSTLIEVATDAVLNVSTSAQMAFVKPKGFQPKAAEAEQVSTHPTVHSPKGVF